MQLRLPDAENQSEVLNNGAAPSQRAPSRQEITGRKGSVYYRAHAYHTKVPPEGIAGLIEHYTNPGEIVVDPFCGSGMTGLACLMTGRQALLSDLSPSAVHIARNYVTPTEAQAVRQAGQTVLDTLNSLERSLYAVDCHKCDQPAMTEYVVWSDVFACPHCSAELLFWSDALSEDRTRVLAHVRCKSCGESSRKSDLSWLRTVPVNVSVSCKRCRRREQRSLSSTEQERILSISRAQIPAWYPSLPFESWREMWRGQHREQGISSSADFFTNRNLWALAQIWEVIQQISDPRIRDAMRFVFTSVVNRASRRYQWNPKRPTNVLGSTLYVASLSYEFNVFSLFRRKLRTVTDLYTKTAELPGRSSVRLSAAQDLSWIPDGSVDYVFTDPPFGSNIFYSDASFLWEAWLGEVTVTEYEAVVHKSQAAEHGGKNLSDYEKLMLGAFREIARILRPSAWASVMFHNSSDEVWSALQRAIEASGFEVGAAVAFDKSQPSFKGIKGRVAGERVPGFDLVLHLTRASKLRSMTAQLDSPSVDEIEEALEARLRDHLATATSTNHSTTPYLHSLAMRVLLEEGLPLRGFTYERIEKLCHRWFQSDNGVWHLQKVERNHA